MKAEVRRYLSQIGRRGGQRSRRKLGAEEARQMVRVREARRAYRRFHAQCFWSSPPDLKVGKADVDCVVDRLQRHGGRTAWEVAGKLCR